MNPNVKPTQVYAVAGGLPPQSIAAAGNATSAYIDTTTGIGWCSVIVNQGALGGGTLSVDILQATSSGGAGAKALATGALSGLATDNKQNVYEFRPEDVLDVADGFHFIAVKVNNVGGSGALVAVDVLVGPQRYLS